MNTKISKITTIFAIMLLSLTFCGCNSENTDANPEATYSYDAEYACLIFYSIDDFRQTINEYKTNEELQKDYRFRNSDFENLDIKYIPNINDRNYKLFFIEINPYRIFYYFVPKDKDKNEKFDHNTGFVVAFSREKGATIEIVREQFNATYEKDGSFYDDNTLYIPLDKSYYSISFPINYKGNKNVISLKNFQ